MIIYKKLARYFPGLKISLIQAGIADEVEAFIKKSVITSLFVSLILSFVFGLVFSTLGISLFFLVLVIPISLIFVFIFLVKGIKAKAARVIREIDKDLINAGRFMLIELNAGVSLFDTMKNASLVYEGVGKPFRFVIDKVNIGKPIEQAIVEVIEITPSLNLRKLLWQIMNSLRTGGNVSRALSAIINQLSREQIISVRGYGKRLNAFVMFYLMIAIVAPSLGVTILSLISIFMKISLNLGNLLAIAFFIFLIQIMFLSVIRTSRPGVMV